MRSDFKLILCLFLIVVAIACRLPSTNPESTASSERVAGRQVVSLLPATSTEARDAYAGSTRCAQCHSKQYDQWRHSAHSRPFDRVATPPHTGNCARCHVTSSAEDSVGCESCHGPQATHAMNPEFIERPVCLLCDIRTECIRCHTRSIDADFVFADAYPKVKHDVPETE